MHRKTDPSNPGGVPWQRWLPHAVVFVRDREGRVCALRTLEDDAPVDLKLGTVIVRATPGVPGPGLVEWSVHASVSRHGREAKAALAIIQYTQVAMRAWQKRLETEREGAGVPAARKAPVTEKALDLFGYVVAAFLLVDPLSHAELGALYHPEIVARLRSMPDLRGRLNLPW